MSGPKFTEHIIPVCAQRRLVPGRHSCQSDLWTQPVETSFRGGFHLQGVHQEPKFLEDHPASVR